MNGVIYKMKVEQVKLIELILYYRIKATTKIAEQIAQIQNKKTLEEIDMYIRQNHMKLNSQQLEIYLEQILIQQELITLMKQVLIEIAEILWKLPNANETVVATIMNPIDTLSQAEKLLNYLQKNKNNKKVMKVGYLLKHNHEIIGN